MMKFSTVVLIIIQSIFCCIGSSVCVQKIAEKSIALNVATQQFHPFIHDDSVNRISTGIDYMIVKTIAQRLQLDIKFIPFQSDSIDDFDLIIGGQNLQSTSLTNFTASSVYYQDDVVWCIRKAGRKSEWDLACTILHWTLFPFVSVGTIATVFIIYTASGYEKRPLDVWTALMYLTQALCAQSPPLKPERATLRFSYFLLLLLSFMSMSMFTSILFTIITNPVYERQITTFDEIVSEEFRLAADKEMKTYLIDTDLLTNGQIETFINCESIAECLDELAKSDTKIAVATSRHHIHTSNIFCLPKSKAIRTNFVALKLREHRVDHVKWNDLIQRLLEGGFMAKWARDAITTSMNDDRTDSVESVNAMGFHLFYLTLFGGGLILALIVFVFEHIVHYKQKQVNCHRFWRVADMVIDGRRHFWNFNRRRLPTPNRVRFNPKTQIFYVYQWMD